MGCGLVIAKHQSNGYKTVRTDPVEVWKLTTNGIILLYVGSGGKLIFVNHY